MQLMTDGMTNRQIAGRLCVTVHAVKFHLASIYRKFEVHNRTEAVVAFLEAMARSSHVARSIVDLSSIFASSGASGYVVAVGLVLAISLAFASVVKVELCARIAVDLLPATADVAVHDASLRDAGGVPVGPIGSSRGFSDAGADDWELQHLRGSSLRIPVASPVSP